MRRRAALCLVFLLATVALGQQPSPAPAKPDGMPPNMEMYPLGFLKKGPKWTPEKTAEIMDRFLRLHPLSPAGRGLG